MIMTELIEKKKHGLELSEDEIRWMIEEYSADRIPDYQMSAMMMAVCFQNMTQKETLALTLAMRDSGDVLDLSGISGVKTDKHSTGGVGDKTSIVLTPLVASVGCKVAKMSGRGLGHTGGTIDKLESFPGFQTSLTTEEFIKQIEDIGIALIGQTKDLAPADKKLYALRDVTATVDQLSLISSSIMSKKLASGADAIVLDVKCGSGAFMKDYDAAVALAKEMVKIGKNAGRKMSALITDMDQPLGYAVGNTLEVMEAIDTLNGHGPADFTELVMALGSRMVLLSGLAKDEESAESLLKEAIRSGKALDRLAAFVAAQGGNPDYVYHPERFETSTHTYDFCAENDGFISSIRCDSIGNVSLLLGGGRRVKTDSIDLSVGLVFDKKVGDPIKAGERIAKVFYNDHKKFTEALPVLKEAVTISSEPVQKNKIVLARFD